MPVETNHPEFTAWIERWERCRDFAAGADAVKARTTTYLPRLDGQGNEEYLAYKSRAPFYGATGRTISGLVGAAFLKAPMRDLPSAVSALFDDIDLNATTFDTLAMRAIEETLTVGRFGVLVDYSDAVARPYVATYPAESIVNWRTEVVDGDRVLSLVVLAEKADARKDDVYSHETRDRRRVLMLEDGIYAQRLYERDPSRQEGRQWVEIGSSVPTIAGAALRFIPFTIIGPMDLGADVEKPPLLDLVNVNLSHYQLGADHAHGLHWVSLPTVWASMGSGEVDGELYVGSSTAWVLPAGSQVGMLEVTGAGFGAQREALNDFREQMAILGARLLGSEKAGVETTAALRIRASAEDATLSSVVASVELGLNEALRVFADWTGRPLAENQGVTLNRDFVPVEISAEELAKHVANWQAGAIGFEELVNILKRAGVVDEETQAEDLAQRIQQERDARGDSVRTEEGRESQQDNLPE